MKLQSIRDLLLALLGGAVAPYALVTALGTLHAVFRGPSDRIYAFLAPTAARVHRFDTATLALDAVCGGALGIALSLVIGRFTRTRGWLMWMVFAAAVILVLLAHIVLSGAPARPTLILRQPGTLFLLGGAWLGFWLGSREGARRATT